MQERKTVGQLMEEMRIKAGAQNYHGHEYMDLQRFAEDTSNLLPSSSCVHPFAVRIARIFVPIALYSSSFEMSTFPSPQNKRINFQAQI